ncbi:MAG: hypothetical protein KBS46_06480 [Clostridiales bacterium]|nr:hypothetical protein [Candidatus Apopatocola equi]
MARDKRNPNSRLGDRREGRRLRSLSAVLNLGPYVMRERNDACDSYADNLEISALEQWLIDKRSEGSPAMNFTHLMVAAYVRTVSMRPGINRFVAARRLFARSDIQVVLRVRKGVGSDSAWTSVKLHCSPTDTIYDIYSRLNAAVDNVQAGTGESDFDRLAASLTRLNRFFLRPFMAVLRMLDYNDWLPRRFLDASPYHASLAICDLGSLGVQSVDHHIHDFGNVPIYLSYGAKRHVYELDREGQVQDRHMVDLRFTVDERIADASYLVEALKCMKYFLKNPQLLELPPETVADDVN